MTEQVDITGDGPRIDKLSTESKERSYTLESGCCPGGQEVYLRTSPFTTVNLDRKVAKFLDSQTIIAAPLRELVVNKTSLILDGVNAYLSPAGVYEYQTGFVKRPLLYLPPYFADPGTNSIFVSHFETADDLVAFLHEEGHLCDSKIQKYFDNNKRLLEICDNFLDNSKTKLSSALADNQEALELWKYLVARETFANRHAKERIVNFRQQGSDFFPTDPKLLFLRKFLIKELHYVFGQEFNNLFVDKVGRRNYGELIKI